MGVIRDAIDTELNKISTARLGEEVRGSIVGALDKIASTFDSMIDEYDLKVQQATQAATDYDHDTSLIENAVEQAGYIQDKIANLDDALTSFTTPTVIGTQYVKNNGLWLSTAPSMLYDSESHRFEFKFPNGPNFPAEPVVTIEGIPDEQGKVNFNPNLGTMSFTLPNMIRHHFNSLTFRTENIEPDANNEYSEDPSVSYNALSKVMTFHLRQGLNGSGVSDMVSELGNRPFILENLWVADNLNFVQGARYDAQSVVPREGRANDFDAAIVILRKSVDNTVGDVLSNRFNGNATEQNKALLDANTDYDSTVAVFLMKPKAGETSTSVTASMVDSKGRTMTRRIRWLSEDHHLVYSGGGTNTWPTVKLVADSVYTASLVNGQSPLGVQMESERFDSAILFENAKIGANGDYPEYTWQGANNYQKVVYRYKKSGKWKNSSCDPIAGANLNKRYNQVLVPVRIIGIKFCASSELIASYTTP